MLCFKASKIDWRYFSFRHGALVKGGLIWVTLCKSGLAPMKSMELQWYSAGWVGIDSCPRRYNRGCLNAVLRQEVKSLLGCCERHQGRNGISVLMEVLGLPFQPKWWWLRGAALVPSSATVPEACEPKESDWGDERAVAGVVFYKVLLCGAQMFWPLWQRAKRILPVWWERGTPTWLGAARLAVGRWQKDLGTWPYWAFSLLPFLMCLHFGGRW